jgi:hypothetical protein
MYLSSRTGRRWRSGVLRTNIRSTSTVSQTPLPGMAARKGGYNRGRIKPEPEPSVCPTYFAITPPPLRPLKGRSLLSFLLLPNAPSQDRELRLACLYFPLFSYTRGPESHGMVRAVRACTFVWCQLSGCPFDLFHRLLLSLVWVIMRSMTTLICMAEQP